MLPISNIESMPVASKDSDSDDIAAYTGGGQHIKIERPPVRIELTLEYAKAEICDKTSIDSYLDLHAGGHCPSKLFNR